MLELIAMIAILWLGVGSMFSVITSGIFFAKDTEDRIKAINLAREWIEWMTNIRNTNWLRFSSDRRNCWSTLSYDSGCIWNPIGWDRIGGGSHVLYTYNGLWYLSGTTSIAPADPAYKTVFRVINDADGFSNQTGAIYPTLCNSQNQVSCTSIFTREIQIIIPTWSTGSMNVKSIVYWDGKTRQKVELETTLTNWKSKF